ncbi:MAG TPA: pilus assembly protein TadG-related protein [Patescibacteria group bacterium]|nr:pilus assembly protein TadG-related protein [Patescibacteria group bacterium]
MQTIRAIRSLAKDEEGASLMFVAISMITLLSMMALAIDVGMIYEAKGQAQNAADSGALAGAGSLIVSPANATLATDTAKLFAEKHLIVKQQVSIVSASDVQVDLANGRVTVTARRIAARGNAVPTFFARIFGRDLVDVEATAIAEVDSASSASCMKPWAIPDAYDDQSAPIGSYNNGDYYKQGVTSWGTNYRNNNYDVGTQLVLKQGTPGSAVAPGQFYPIDLPLPNGPTTGGARYKENIESCNGQVVNINDSVMTETGNMVGPTKQGVQDLIDQDPGARWDPALGVVNSAFPPGGSPRIGRVPMFDPSNPPTSGKQSLKITNIAGFFIEGVKGNGDVTGRLVFATGSGAPTPGTMLTTVRLVR